ncbi:MAG: amidohydrolase [Oscillospiraceae bacterium]|nr:amidohydrolase [Oscillospiraceae bacterium]
MNSKDRIVELVDSKKDFFSKVSDDVWATPELGFLEFKSAATLEKALEEQGFKVEKGLAGIETAFKGTYGSGKPVFGFLGEFDALPLLSQKAGLGVHDPIVEGGCGHGCGHNALGAGSMAAATALKDYLRENNLPGTVVYFGCPAEESGCGKTFMAREGVFDGIDIALTWHPGDTPSLFNTSSLANIIVLFHFKGIASHAAASPHMGRSALDAAELMNVGVQFLREHVIQEARIHYAFTDVGGGAPNVVQNTATVLYYIRAPKTEQVMEIYPRVVKCAEGAAHMTETELTVEIKTALSDYIPNDVVSNVMSECMQELGNQEFSEESRKIAKSIHESLTEAEINSGIKSLSRYMSAEEAARIVNEEYLVATPFKYKRLNYAMPGSTDVGDVSYVVPTAQLTATTEVIGTSGHSWQIASVSGTSLAHEGLNYAAKAMALTAVRLIEKPELIQRAKDELFSVTGGVYNCPIPKDVKPQP